jgi:5-carboxymethyl-2-hydroxymuconate isomerase
LLPAFERLNDVRSRAVTWGKIADVFQARGQLDEALRIRQEEELPVYERLGDVRSRAVTLGQIAVALAARGDFKTAFAHLREAKEMFARLRMPRESEWVREWTVEVLEVLASRIGETEATEFAALFDANDGEAAHRFLQAHLGDGE